MAHLEIHGRPFRKSRLVSQSRNLVLNVFKYFRRQGDYEYLSEIEERTSEATLVTIRLVKKIRSEAKRSESGSIESPPRKQKSSHILNSVNDFDREVIRGEILALYDKGEQPTLDLLLDKVKEPPMHYCGGRTTLWKIVKELGYRYKRDSSGRAILMETDDDDDASSHDIDKDTNSTHNPLQTQVEDTSEDDKEGAKDDNSEDGTITISTAKYHLKDILDLMDSGKFSVLQRFRQIFKDAFQASELTKVQTHDRPRPARQSRVANQSKYVVLNVFNYFRAQGGYKYLSEVEDLTAEATQVTRRVVREITTEAKKSEVESAEPPPQKKNSCRILNSVDDDREAIRREILAFYERGEQPTLDLLLERVKEPPMEYHGGRTTLWKIVKDLGFKYKRDDSGRAVLLESDEAKNHERNIPSSTHLPLQKKEEFTEEETAEKKVNEDVGIVSLLTVRNHLDDILDLIDHFKYTSLHKYYGTFKEARNVVSEYQQTKTYDHIQSRAKDCSHISCDLSSPSASKHENL